MPLTVLDCTDSTQASQIGLMLARMRFKTTDQGGPVSDIVQPILQDVGARGDQAVVEYMRKWTNPAFGEGMIRVAEAELGAAEKALTEALRGALGRAIDHVRAYQTHIKPADPAMIDIEGALLGLRFEPVRRVGLMIPGGKANYPSSLIMSAVPAQVAGVKEIAVCCPPPTSNGKSVAGDVSPLVLAVASMLGISEVYRIGGAQAVGAMAYGTGTVGRVDFIAGPGNSYVQEAKRQVSGLVGIDAFYGPSEVTVIADESAKAAYVAADLIAQAEHDPGSCYLISTSRRVLEKIAAEVDRQVAGRNRADAIRKSIDNWSALILVPDERAAAEASDLIAAEHVTLAVKEPERWLKMLRNGGAFFLGDQTPVASGDYYAGPSHCLPTGSTARFSSGLSVYTFLKRSSVEQYPNGLPEQAIEDIALLAEAEGLDGHAHSVRVRGTD